MDIKAAGGDIMLRIALCDDEQEARDQLRFQLEKSLYETDEEIVYEFSSGETAVRWLKKHPGEIDLLFLDVWLIQKKAKDRFVIPGTEGHPGYEFTDWMKGYALPEHLLQWPLLLCPLMAAAQAGLGLLFQKIG